MGNVLRHSGLLQKIKNTITRKTLKRYFCLCAFALFFLLNSLLFVNAQSLSETVSWPSPEYQLHYDTDSAHCGDDGAVFYWILHLNANTGEYDTVKWNSATSSYYTGDDPIANQLDLNLVRIYRRANPSDSAHYSSHFYRGGVDTFPVNVAGTYYVGIEALTNEVVRYEGDTILIIGTDYIPPQAPAFVTVATTEEGYGRRPSLTCAPTGREQLKVIGGRYPFVATIYDDNGDFSHPFRVDTVWSPGSGKSPQINPSDSTKWRYWEYYTVDTLPEGRWRIQLTDSCGNTGQYTIQTINLTEPTVLDHIDVYAAPLHENDSNIVQINVVFNNCEYDYYFNRAFENMRYRFYWEGEDSMEGVFPDKEFRSFTGTATSADNGKKKVLIIDTVAVNYCEILNSTNRNFKFELQYDSCQVDKTATVVFPLEFPNPNNFKYGVHLEDDGIVPYSLCDNLQYLHGDYFHIAYDRYNPGHTTRNQEDLSNRYHFTNPLEWTYFIQKRDNEGNLIDGESVIVKKEEVAHINTESKLYAQELIDSLPWVDDLPINEHMRVELRDAKGCLIYSWENNIALNYVMDTVPLANEWKITKTGGDHCCDVPYVITLEELNPPMAASLGPTTISLVRSPYDDMYNFSMTFYPEDGSWSEVTKYNFMNTAEIYGQIESGAPKVVFSQPCLPSGTYEFSIISSNCGKAKNTTKTWNFSDVFSTEIVDYPAYEMRQVCANMMVTYTAGSANLVKRHVDPGNGWDEGSVVIPCNTEIKVINGPAGGYDPHLKYGLNDEILLSIPGTYVIEIKPVPPGNDKLCETQVFDYDTIEYATAAFDFEYAVALLCKSNDLDGNVFIKGKNGALPFTYILYDHPDADFNPNPLTIDTNDNGHFEFVHFAKDDTLSCLILDACGAKTRVMSITPLILANMQKVWFDNGGTTITHCEGESVHVHALQVGDYFTFKWWFDTLRGYTTDVWDTVELSTASNPNLFLSHGAQSGWYHVSIMETGCFETVEDSVYIEVKPAPSLQILGNTTVCPNQPATLTFIPKASHDTIPLDTRIDFSVRFSNANGIFQLDTFGFPDQPVQYSFTSVTDTKVYPFSIQEQHPGSCDAYIGADPDDTVYIYMDISRMVNLCSVQATDTMVCYDGTANFIARSTDDMSSDYTMNWYSDYAQTQLLKTETLHNGQVSQYDTSNLVVRTVLFVNVDMDGICPATNGIANAQMIFGSEPHTELDCNKIYRLFDSGGEDGNYMAGELKSHVFYTTDGSRVMLHVNSLDLSNVSFLYVFSGGKPVADSLIYTLGKGSALPEYILSNCDTMTLCFRADKLGGPGWDAIIQHAPGIAVADIYPRTLTTLKTKLCQMKNAKDCDYPYEHRNELKNVKVEGFANFAALDNAIYSYIGMAKSEPYVLEGVATDALGAHILDRNGCDSTVRFELTVSPPPTHHTTVVITSMETPYSWLGDYYDETGIYEKVVTDNTCDCDTMEVLDLIVLKTDIDPKDVEICENSTDSVELKIAPVEAPEKMEASFYQIAIGDVLCTNGEILRPDSFMTRKNNGDTNLQPKGVVFDINSDGNSGRAIALRDASDEVCQFAFGTRKADGTSNDDYSMVTSGSTIGTGSGWTAALQDMRGEEKTLSLKNKCETEAIFSGDRPNAFMVHAPAAALCYYYNEACIYSNDTTPGTEHRNWYLPAAGELYRYFVRRDIVNSTLKLLQSIYPKVTIPYEQIGEWQGQKPPGHKKELDCKYHTATESSSKNVYRIDYKGMVNQKHKKWIIEDTVPITQISPNPIKVQVDASYYFHYARAIIKF